MKGKQDLHLDSKHILEFANLVLFESNEICSFTNDNFIKLSPNFLKCLNETPPEKSHVESDYFFEKLGGFYKELDELSKDFICFLILNNNSFMSTMTLIFIGNKNLNINGNTGENQFLFFEYFTKEMLKSRNTGLINKYIYNYFAIMFEQIFFIEISKNEFISKKIFNRTIKSIAAYSNI